MCYLIGRIHQICALGSYLLTQWSFNIKLDWFYCLLLKNYVPFKYVHSFWSDKESRALVEALQEFAFDPMWRTDCGFKNGYTGELHKRILIKLPTFSKQVDPHIGSKLKSKFHTVNEMSDQSGCSWNYAKKKIKGEGQWYENWVKVWYSSS